MTPGASLSGQRVLVTGGSGFIGSRLCDRLVEGGADVHAVWRVRKPHDERSLRWWHADLAELDPTREVFSSVKPQLVFHLASQPLGGRELSLVIPLFRNNLMSTVNLLVVAAESGCRRIVLAGSLEEPDVKAGPSAPSSPYAAAKWASSSYARMFHALWQSPVVILRTFMVYGPGQRDLKKLIPHIILSLLRGEIPKLTSGRREVDWIYVDDVVEAYLAAADAEGIEGTTLDVGSGKLVSVRTVATQLFRLIRPELGPVFGALDDRPLEQVRVADVARSSRMMGWKPRVSLEEGLRSTIAWYQEQLKTEAL